MTTRHGVYSRYTEGCRCGPCRAASTRARKRHRLRLLSGPLKRPRVGAARRIQALCAIGWPRAIIAAEMGYATVGSLGSLLHRRSGIDMVTTTRHARVVEVYERLSGTPGPCARTARHARKAGWAPPLAWEGIDIDDPAATPDTGEQGQRGADLDEWLHLARAGEDPERAARRLGVTLDAVERKAQRAGRRDVLDRLHRRDAV